jgi:pimeloyl-ACP methyl ester carboxylesterase
MEKPWKRALKIISLGLFALIVVLLILINILAKQLIKDEAEMQETLTEIGQRHPIQTDFLNIEDYGKIRYAHIGVDTLPLLVLIHGSPGDLNAFDSWFADTLLTSRYQLIAYDRPGFGLSQMDVQKKLDVQKHCVSAILDHIKAPSYFILGHSYGGAVVLSSMLEERETIEHSIIVAGSVDPELEPREWWRPIISSDLVSWTLPRMLRSSNQEIEALYDELILLERSMNTAMDLPLTVFQGLEDKLVPAANADYLNHKIPGSETVWFEDEGHFILWSKQADIVDYLINLVDE